jgi:uncharacterized lipoprotein YddW (UPF0748 family)
MFQRFCLLFLSTLFAILSLSTVVLAQAPRPINGVWITNIDSNVLFDADRLKSAIQDLAQANFNSLYPAMWNNGATLYPSQTLQKAIGTPILSTPAGLANRDPLQEIVTEGHRQNLRVISWMEFGLMAPADSELAKQHPDWLTQKRDGGKIWPDGSDQRVWLNPLHPEVRSLILNLVTEVARYDIDGIQFDDHLGLPADFGYDPLMVKAYKLAHRGAEPSNNSQDPEWQRWRSVQITQLLEDIFRTLKKTNPKAILSLSPNPYPFAYNQFLQNWPSWERRGYVEELIVQIYKNSLPGFITELDRREIQQSRTHIPTAIGVLAGLKGRQVSFEQIQAQVKAVRDKQYGGVSFFFYETLWNLTPKPEARKAAFTDLLRAK